MWSTPQKTADLVTLTEEIQTIRRQIADELFECVWPFCESGT